MEFTSFISGIEQDVFPVRKTPVHLFRMIHARLHKREAAFFNHLPGTDVVLSFFLILFGCSEKAPFLY